jgi:hypothetical protein
MSGRFLCPSHAAGGGVRWRHPVVGVWAEFAGVPELVTPGARPERPCLIGLEWSPSVTMEKAKKSSHLKPP